MRLFPTLVACICVIASLAGCAMAGTRPARDGAQGASQAFPGATRGLGGTPSSGPNPGQVLHHCSSTGISKLVLSFERPNRRACIGVGDKIRIVFRRNTLYVWKYVVNGSLRCVMRRAAFSPRKNVVLKCRRAGIDRLVAFADPVDPGGPPNLVAVATIRIK